MFKATEVAKHFSLFLKMIFFAKEKCEAHLRKSMPWGIS